MPVIDASKILILATDGFEQPELFRPRERLKDLGAEVRIAALGRAPIRGREEGADALCITPNLTLEQVDCAEFDALLIPGGDTSPATLLGQPRALEIVRGFAEAGKPVAALCRGADLLVEAELLPAAAVEPCGDVRREGGFILGGTTGQVVAFTDALIEMVEGR